MTRTLRRKAAWMLCGALVGFGVLALPKLAFAAPCEERYWAYYSNASWTTLVGGDGLDCDGARSPYLWGTSTNYYLFRQCCCNNPNCGNPPYDYGCDPALICHGGSCPAWINQFNPCQG
jgi:hypothetical protein